MTKIPKFLFYFVLSVNGTDKVICVFRGTLLLFRIFGLNSHAAVNSTAIITAKRYGGGVGDGKRLRDGDLTCSAAYKLIYTNLYVYGTMCTGLHGIPTTGYDYN